ARVGGGSVVSQTLAVDEPIDLAADRLLFQVPVRAGGNGTFRHVHVLCGVEDDFKGRFDRGACVYLNRPIGEWLTRHGVKPADVWPASVARDERTLWTARLFVATDRRDAAASATRLASSAARSR